MSRADRERCHIWQAVGCIDDQLEKACEEMSTANRRIVDVKAPENVFMCCCPKPYGPCTGRSAARATSRSTITWGRLCATRRATSPLAARELVEGARYWEGDGVGPSCNALPDIDGGYVELTEEEKRRARAGEVEGDEHAPTYNWTSGVCGGEVGRSARSRGRNSSAKWRCGSGGAGRRRRRRARRQRLRARPQHKASVRMGNARKGLRLEYEEGNRLMKALETKLDRDDHAKGRMASQADARGAPRARMG